MINFPIVVINFFIMVINFLIMMINFLKIVINFLIMVITSMRLPTRYPLAFGLINISGLFGFAVTPEKALS